MKSRGLFFTLVFLVHGFSITSSTTSFADGGVPTPPAAPCNLDFNVHQWGSIWAERGKDIQQTILIENTGTCRLSRPVLIDYLPSSVTFGAATPTPSVTPQASDATNQVIWKGHYFDPGATVVLQVTGGLSLTTPEFLVQKICFFATDSESPGANEFYRCDEFTTHIVDRLPTL